MRLPRDVEAAVLATPGVEVRGAVGVSVPPASVPEKTFMQFVIDLARVWGWLVYHTFDSRRSPSGFPDLVLSKGGRIVAIECKAAKGRPTAAQLAWLEAFRAGGCEAYLFRPADWNAVVEVLTR